MRFRWLEKFFRRTPPVDLLEQVRLLQKKLIELEHSDWARRLDEAELGGATGTEIILRIGSCVRELNRAAINLPPEVRASLKSILGEVDRRFKKI